MDGRPLAGGPAGGLPTGTPASTAAPVTVTLLTWAVVRPPYRSLRCRNTSAPPFPAVSTRRPNTSILQQRTQTPRGFSPSVWSSVQMVNIFLVLEPECPHLRPGSWVYCASRNMGRFGCRTRKSLVSTLFCLLVSLVPSRVLRTRGPTSGALGNTWAQLGPSDPDQTRHPQPGPGEHPCLPFSTSASSTPVLTILPLPHGLARNPQLLHFLETPRSASGGGWVPVPPRAPDRSQKGRDPSSSPHHRSSLLSSRRGFEQEPKTPAAPAQSPPPPASGLTTAPPPSVSAHGCRRGPPGVKSGGPRGPRRPSGSDLTRQGVQGLPISSGRAASC